MERNDRGEAASTTCWVEQEARLVTARKQAQAAVFQGKIYCAGGVAGLFRALSSVEVFDPIVGRWQENGDLTQPRVGEFSLFVLGDSLYAAGGADGGLAWIERRDTQTGEWELISELDEERASSSVVGIGEDIYFLVVMNELHRRPGIALTLRRVLGHLKKRVDCSKTRPSGRFLVFSTAAKSLVAAVLRGQTIPTLSSTAIHHCKRENLELAFFSRFDCLVHIVSANLFLQI